MSTTTTFASGLPAASFTRPVIVIVARGGLFIFSTGEESSVLVEAGAGVGSGEEVGPAAAGAAEPGAPASGGVVCGVVTGASGDKAGVEDGVGAASPTGVAGSAGVADGVISG